MAHELTIYSNRTFIGPVSIEAKVGDTVIFTYIVTNDGRASLNEIKAIDDRPGVYRSLMPFMAKAQ